MPHEQPNWETILHIMSTFQSFDGLKNYVFSHLLHTLTCTINAHMSEVDREHLDFVALNHVPNDVPQGYTPISIEGNGNCSPQTLSFLCFNTEDRHAEMHVGIIYEGVKNMERYIDNNNICKGAIIIYRRGNTVMQIARFSDNYNRNKLIVQMHCKMMAKLKGYINMKTKKKKKIKTKLNCQVMC